MIVGIDASRASVSQRTGTENYSYSLVKALIENDRQNQYVLYFQKDLDFGLSKSKNVSTKIIDLPRLWTQLGLATEITLRPPDVLFIPAHTLPMLRRPGMKTVVTIHDLGYEFLPEYHKFPQKLYLNKSTVYAVKNATHLIAVSQATKDDLVSKLHANPDKITVIHEGFDKTYFKPQSAAEVARVRSTLGLTRDYLLFVGTIQPRKNLERLLQAYAHISGSVPYDLVLSGKSGWLNDALYGLPDQLGIADRVHFLGFTSYEDLPALYTGATAFVYPSLFEGFGLPILEAYGCGVPVLTSTVSSMPEVAGDGAVLVDPYDIESISRGLIQIVSDKSLRTQLTRKGTQRVHEFSWEKTAKQTIEVFEKVYNSSSK